MSLLAELGILVGRFLQICRADGAAAVFALAIKLKRDLIGRIRAPNSKQHQTINMRKNIVLILAAILVSFYSLSAEENKAKIDFAGVAPQQALAVYANLSGLELITDSHVQVLRSKIVLHNSRLSKNEMMASLEKALIEQAGVVITHLDVKRASVTYNDALPLTIAKP